MHIEEQLRGPLPTSCTPLWPGANPLLTEGVGLLIEPFPDKPVGIMRVATGYWEHYYLYVAKSCTEFASDAYPREWWEGLAGYGWPSFVHHGAAFRPIDVAESYQFPDPNDPTAEVVHEHILMPDFGAVKRKWWYSGNNPGATAAELTDVINGKAWAAGHFKNDNIKKKLVCLARSKLTGKFRFILNEWKPGDAWWWDYGASINDIKTILDGGAWASFRKDGIKKRLVLLRRHADDNWTFIMVPENGLGWVWHHLVSEAASYNHRIISIAPFELPDPASGDVYNATVADPVTAVTVQNT